MDLDQTFADLQADPALQVQAQVGLVTALATWQASPQAQPVLDGFARFAEGTPLAALDALSALFGGDEAQGARNFVAPLLTAWSLAMSDQPLGLVPLRHVANRASASLLLATAGEATLTLVALDGAALNTAPAAQSASFAPSEVWEVILSGTGEARLVERRGETITAHPLSLEPGLALGRDGEREALLIDAVDGAMVLLRLQRRVETMQPRREFALADGRLLRQASATPRESRHEVAVALLGRMGRKDAAPLLAEIARDEGHGDSLRWQALRECLGLDSATGFWTLTAISRGGSDPLAVPAGALRAQLLETYPQLAEVEMCPA